MPNNDLVLRADVLDLAQSYGPATYDMPYGSGDMIIRPEDVMALPAVDAAPVRHGRWIYKERHRKSYRQYTGYDAVGDIHTVTVLEETGGKEPYCSECGAQAAESYMDFCPHCGATMDGGEDNEIDRR